MKRMRTIAALAILVLSAAACSHNSVTDPSLDSSSSTTTPATPTVTEQFNGTLPVGGFKFYSFNIAVNGTVNVTLSKVSGGANVPTTVQLGLGIGTPAGPDCTTTVTATASSSFAAPQATGTFGPGLFCVRVFDVGNLAGPATFAVTIAHP